MEGYTVRYLYKSGNGDDNVYLASDVDARIAELEKGLRAALRWLQRGVQQDVASNDPTDGYNASYKNDLADMRRAHRSLLGS